MTAKRMNSGQGVGLGPAGLDVTEGWGVGVAGSSDSRLGDGAAASSDDGLAVAGGAASGLSAAPGWKPAQRMMRSAIKRIRKTRMGELYAGWALLRIHSY